MISIPKSKYLEPYFKIAEGEAKKSPCSRRQYGAVIVEFYSHAINYTTGYNQRISSCCNGNICARDRRNLPTNGRHVEVEVGAEVHAETAALIAHRGRVTGDASMVLAAYKGAQELLGEDVWPCHVCALNLKFAGLSHIYIRNKQREIIPVSVSEIIESRESEWEVDV